MYHRVVLTVNVTLLPHRLWHHGEMLQTLMYTNSAVNTKYFLEGERHRTTKGCSTFTTRDVLLSIDS